jgi:hypothetical protein
MNVDITCEGIPSRESNLYGNMCPARRPCSRPTFRELPPSNNEVL